MTAAQLDPAAIKAEHARFYLEPECKSCGNPWPCQTYDLAEALATAQDKIAKVLDLAQQDLKCPCCTGYGSIIAALAGEGA